MSIFQSAKSGVFLGSFFGFLSVALGAFAAHGLRNILSEQYLKVFQTGVTYQFYHSLALILAGLSAVALGESNAFLLYTIRLFVIGIVLFSGSLYALALTEITILGAITPLGGLCFLSGWICFSIFGYQLI